MYVYIYICMKVSWNRGTPTIIQLLFLGVSPEAPRHGSAVPAQRQAALAEQGRTLMGLRSTTAQKKYGKDKYGKKFGKNQV